MFSAVYSKIYEMKILMYNGCQTLGNTPISDLIFCTQCKVTIWSLEWVLVVSQTLDIYPNKIPISGIQCKLKIFFFS